jgi:hypothetical protein
MGAAWAWPAGRALAAWALAFSWGTRAGAVLVPLSTAWAAPRDNGPAAGSMPMRWLGVRVSTAKLPVSISRLGISSPSRCGAAPGAVPHCGVVSPGW